MTVAPWQRNETVVAPTKAPEQDESSVQRQCVAFLRVLERQGRLSFMAIPNGAALRGNKEERARHMTGLKMLGLRPGAPDIVIILPNKRAAWAELKRPKGGRLSEDQKEWRDLLQALGHDWRLVRSLDDMKDYVNFLTGIDRAPDQRPVNTQEEHTLNVIE